MKISPTSKAHVNTIKYSSTGKIASNLYQSEIEDLLNLNVKYLKKMRRDAWLEIFRLSQ
ncbi:MAG: hypothetical protein AAF806_30075 [Bacteroidota bacterium]